MNSRFSILMTAASMSVLGACASSVAQEADAPQVDMERSYVFVKSNRTEHQTKMILKADTDGDGKVSKEEFSQRHFKVFDKMDANKDGFISKDEATKHVAERLGKATKRMEQRRASRQISKEEREKLEAEMRVLEKEMRELGIEMGELGRELGRSMAHSFRLRSHGGHDVDFELSSEENIEEKIEAHKNKAMEDMDKNGDGKISKDEYPGPDRRFARMDKNDDGFVSRDELVIRMSITRTLDGFPPQMSERVFVKIDEDEEK